MGNEASGEGGGRDDGTAAPPPPQADNGAAAATDGQSQESMSYWTMAKVGYQELVNAIIRPPRAEYEIGHLGPAEFRFGPKLIRRTDFELTNERGMNIRCSHWEPVERRSRELPCLVYLHGNSSARVEAISQLSLCLAVGLTMFAFDFTGSGKSDGDYVSLGFYEREDLRVVVDYLRNSGKVSTIGLWGRSMGAATALLHGDRDPSIAAMVLDSPFADLTQLAEEMVDKGRENGLTVPGFVAGIAIRMIRGSVQKQAGFNIRDLSPESHADRCFIPALFVAAEGDDFIKPHHSDQIHSKYAGDKNLVRVEGDHNSPRSKFLYDSAAIFLQTYMGLPQEGMVPGVDPYNNGYPPWHCMDFNPFSHLGQEMPYEELAMGMNAERQRQTQQALFDMLSVGQGSRVVAPAQPQPAPAPGAVASAAGSASVPVPASAQPLPNSLPGGAQLPPLVVPAESFPLPPAGSSREPVPWTCTVCTFSNSGPHVITCLACGTPHPDAVPG